MEEGNRSVWISSDDVIVSISGTEPTTNIVGFFFDAKRLVNVTKCRLSANVNIKLLTCDVVSSILRAREQLVK